MLHNVDTDSDDDTFEPDPTTNIDLHPHGGGRRYRQRSDKHHHSSSHYRRQYRNSKQQQVPAPLPRVRSSSTPQVVLEQDTMAPPPGGDVNRNMPSVPRI